MPVAKPISRFRTPAVIERPDPEATADETGKVDLADDANWETYSTVRIELLAVTANERVYAQQPVGDITHRVTMRHNVLTASITPRMRVRVGTRKLNITRAIEVGNPARLIELSCTEVV
jgi:SPP1 family predicted phage head-tail adaptor